MAKSNMVQCKWYITAYSYYHPKSQEYYGPQRLDNKDAIPQIFEYTWVGMADCASAAAVKMLSSYFTHPDDVPEDLFCTNTEHNMKIWADQRGHRNSTPKLDATGSYIVSATIDDGSAQYCLVDCIILDLFYDANNRYDPFCEDEDYE